MALLNENFKQHENKFEFLAENKFKDSINNIPIELKEQSTWLYSMLPHKVKASADQIKDPKYKDLLIATDNPFIYYIKEKGKYPCNVSGYNVSYQKSTNHNTFSTVTKFNELGLYNAFHLNNNYCCIDIDNAFNGELDLYNWASDTLNMFMQEDCYIEKSVSGKGIHIIFKITDKIKSIFEKYNIKNQCKVYVNTMKKELSPMPDNCQIEVFINRPIIITGDIYENKNPEKIDPASYNVELLLKSIINKNNYTENVKSYVTKCKKKNIDNKGVDENFLTSSHNINIISKEDQDFNNVFDFIKYSITLEDLFKYYDVKVSNKNILCPLPDHSEKNPSFRANHLLNLWYCHSCQSGGSIIDLVMKMEGCNKLEAAKKINEIFNLGITFNKKLEAKQKEDYILNLHTEKIKNQGAIIDNTSIDWISVEVNERTGKTKSKILCPILAKYLQDQSHFIFAKDDVFGGEKHFYYYEGSYKPITSKEFKGHIKKYIPLDLQSMGVLSEVYNLLTNDLNYYSFEDLNPENYINFKNGLLNLDTWQLEEHNPNILTTIQLNCNYDVNTKVKGNVWNKFMNDFCITEDIKHIYKQIIGLAISNFDCSIFKNAIFTVGKHDTGKSKLKQLCEYMLGKGNYNNVELGKLEENFGTANLFNKRLVGSSDMRFMKITELAIFKNITGGDNFNVSFKYEGDFTYKYKGLLWNVTNRLPTFSLDTDKEIYNRFVILKHDNVIKKEDQNKTLMIDLINELDYIVVDVLNSFKSVVENKKLDIPVSCEAERHIYKNENNISLNFAQNFCREIETDKTNECIETTILHAIFKEFCKSYNNGFVPKISEFKETLNSNGIATIKPSNGKYYYYPLHINSLCYQEFVYLIHPSLKERILKQLNCNENTIWDSLGKEE